MSDDIIALVRTCWPMTLGALVASPFVGVGAAALTLLLGCGVYALGRALESAGASGVARLLLGSSERPVYRLDTAVIADALSDGDFDEED